MRRAEALMLSRRKPWRIEGQQIDAAARTSMRMRMKEILKLILRIIQP
jgi:hypothetical protein